MSNYLLEKSGIETMLSLVSVLALMVLVGTIALIVVKGVVLSRFKKNEIYAMLGLSVLAFLLLGMGLLSHSVFPSLDEALVRTTTNRVDVYCDSETMRFGQTTGDVFCVLNMYDVESGAQLSYKRDLTLLPLEIEDVKCVHLDFYDNFYDRKVVMRVADKDECLLK